MEASVSLTSKILVTIGSQTLKKIVIELGLRDTQQIDLRSPSAMRDALSRSRAATAAFLLRRLTEEELAKVADACCVPRGLQRARLVDELLQADAQPALSPRRSQPSRRRRFVAIDFETADYQRDSACALALVLVEDNDIVERRYHLIRPPRKQFVFSYLHGITWQQVASQPAFHELWPLLAPWLKGSDFLAAHNAPFDRSVLRACCAAAGLAPPTLPFLCTVRLARQAWGLSPATLPDVCRHLRIPLQHHHAASDAEACARIVIAATRGTGAAARPLAAEHAVLPG